MTQDDKLLPPLQQTADRPLINDLFRNGFINQEARDLALEHLYPPFTWGAWTLQILTYLGTFFVLTGIIFYFAYNWENMSDYYKFISIQLGIIICIVGSFFYLDKLAGKLFLTAASILIGVFMAVFGQIYQTGADASALFITWCILIFPWVFIGQFAPLWFIWITLVNIALILFWQQEVASYSIFFLFGILILLNVFFLFLRESLAQRFLSLQGRWSRVLLAIGILFISVIAIEEFILYLNWQNPAIVISSTLGILVLAYFLYYFGRLNKDKWVYALTIISLSLIICTLGYKILVELKFSEILLWFMMSLITLLVFSTGAYILRR